MCFCRLGLLSVCCLCDILWTSVILPRDAMPALCPVSVSVCNCHESVFYRNDWADRAGSRHGRFLRSKTRFRPLGLWTKFVTAARRVNIAPIRRSTVHSRRVERRKCGQQACPSMSYDSERKRADTVGTVLVPWAGHFRF